MGGVGIYKKGVMGTFLLDATDKGSGETPGEERKR